MNTVADVPDEVLVKGYQDEHNEEAFSVLYRRYRNQLLSFIHSHLWNRPESDSEDILQETFAEFYSVPALLPGGTVQSLLYTIASRCVNAHVERIEARRRGGTGGRHRTANTDAWMRQTLEEIDPTQAEDEAAQDRIRGKIGDLIDALSEEEACVIRMIWLEGYKAPATAEALGWTLSKVRWRIRQAFHHMRAMLEAA